MTENFVSYIIITDSPYIEGLIEMNYMRLCSVLRRNKMYLFTLRDVKNLFPYEKEKTIKNNFIRWVSHGYFVRLKRDLYEFIEQGVERKIPDFYVANRLYGPSYVSLETALSLYSIIPDIAAGVTSLTTMPTRVFKNRYGSFYYKTCTQRAFTGYQLMKYDGFKINIADKEKALVDFFYFRFRSGYSLDFKDERFNKIILKKFNWKKSFSYAKLFNSKTLKAIKECKEYVQC